MPTKLHFRYPTAVCNLRKQTGEHTKENCPSVVKANCFLIHVSYTNQIINLNINTDLNFDVFPTASALSQINITA